MSLQTKRLLVSSTSDGFIIPALLKLSVAKDIFAKYNKNEFLGKNERQKKQSHIFSFFPKFLSLYADIKLHFNKYSQNK